jgi:gamma-glutamylcyclotransferase
VQKSELIFVYGSNMDPAQMRERCPESDLAWFIAKAHDRALSFPRKSAKRTDGVGSLKISEGEVVWGVVFSVSERDLGRLDSFEGVPKSCTREWLEVSTEDGSHRRVLTYIAKADNTPPQEYTPHKDYIKLCLRGAEYFRLPADYVVRLRQIKTKGSEE